MINRPPLLDEEQDELEFDYEDFDDYRPLDFDDTSFYDRRLEPDTLEDFLDQLEEEEEGGSDDVGCGDQD